LIGAGGRGGIAINWHKPNGKSVVVAAADVNKGILDGFKERVNPDAFLTQDYRDLLTRDDIDAIAVCSPDFTHEEYAVAALKAGKHVFCEKPLAITTEGCDHILEEWKKSGMHLMVGFNMRYMPIFRVMKDIVDSGVIGEIKAAWVRHFVAHGGEWYYHDWHANRKNTTGLLLQKASHDIDMIHWITGHYTKKVAAFGSLDYYGGDKPNDLTCPTCPEKETCVEVQLPEHLEAGRMTQCALRQEVDVEDNNAVIMELDNGIKASYMQCHFAPDYHRNYTFIGTEGRMENLDDWGNVKVLLRDRSKRWKNLADQDYHVKPASGTHGGADPMICNDFVDMILSGKEPVATPIAGRMSVATACTATDSLRNGGVLRTVPDLPEFLK
jgi:predicted dehydrogenase